MTKKEKRKVVFEKYGGKCAYCGCDLNGRWCVDHIVPIFRNDTEEGFERRATFRGVRTGLKRGTNDVENFNPACSICNGWKATLTLEAFRSELSKQVERARSYSPNFRMAEKFGLIQETGISVKFYFESTQSPNTKE